QVLHIRGEVRIGEIALASAEPGEVEAQYRDAARRERLGDAFGREIVFPAGEAVCKERKGGRLANRPFEPRGELLALAVGKFEAFRGHGALPYAWSMIFSENRLTLFGIMLYFSTLSGFSDGAGTGSGGLSGGVGTCSGAFSGSVGSLDSVAS